MSIACINNLVYKFCPFFGSYSMMSDTEDGTVEFQTSNGTLQSSHDSITVPSIPLSEPMRDQPGNGDMSEDSPSSLPLDTDGRQTAVLAASESHSRHVEDRQANGQCSEINIDSSDELGISSKPVLENENFPEIQIDMSNDVVDVCQAALENLQDKLPEVQFNKPESKDHFANKISDEKEDGLSMKTKMVAQSPDGHSLKLKQMRASTMYTDFICPICESLLSDPCCLGCLHAVCSNCLTVEEQKVRCPTCFTETDIPGGDIGALPRSKVLAALAEKQSTGTKQCEVCRLMKKKSDATGFCLECKDYLCQDCWNVHKFTKFTLNHKVISLDGSSIEELEIQNRRQTENSKCSRHSNEDLKYFCKGCEMNVCTDCILLDHQNHPCISVQEAYEKQKMNLDLMLKGVDDQIQRIQMEDFEMGMAAADLAEEVEIEKIKSTVEKVIQDIQKQEKEAVASVQVKFKSLKGQYKKRQSSAHELLYHLKEAKTICSQFCALSNCEEFMALEKMFCRRLVHVLNMILMPEPISWYEKPSVELDPLLQNDCKLKSLFKVTNYSKCYDWTKDMPCVGTVKEIYKDRELCVKAGHPEWFLRNHKYSSEEVYNMPLKEEGLLHKREGMMDTGISLSTQSESGSTANSENYEDMGAKPKTISPKKKRGRKKKNTASSMENISPCNQIPGGGISGMYNSDFFDTEAYGATLSGQYPGYIEMSEACLNPSSHNPLKYPTTGIFPGVGYMMNSASLNALTDISKKVKITKQASHPSKTQNKDSKENAKAKPKSAPEEAKSKKAKATKTKPANSSVSITPKWRLDTKCADDKDVPFLTSVHPIQHDKVVVSDSMNHKIKMFSIDGNFLKSFDAINPTSVIFVCGTFVWTTGHTIIIKDQNDEFEKVINFQNDTIPHPLSWYPQSHFAVACGDHLRIYHVDKDKQNFTKKCQISFQLPNQQRMSNIFSVKSNGNGKSLVMTDWDLKAVVVGDQEGKVTGMYTVVS